MLPKFISLRSLFIPLNLRIAFTDRSGPLGWWPSVSPSNTRQSTETIPLGAEPFWMSLLRASFLLAYSSFAHLADFEKGTQTSVYGMKVFSAWLAGQASSESPPQPQTPPPQERARACFVLGLTLFLSYRGGVFTPGAAFSRTKLIDRLNQRGIEFSVISSSEV